MLNIRGSDLTELRLASSETARVIDRDIVLELIRTNPFRANLAQRSGLDKAPSRRSWSSLSTRIGCAKVQWTNHGETNEDMAAIAVDIHPMPQETTSGGRVGKSMW
ncbi:hypothetical protein EDE15_3189 [Edaphobacter aggregans]|uniref:Uncharacterized protein n=1 Tax=Edaphobacter aggregans TaxID=570835 RepID=A0A3R9PAZ5_9BACT|nr:hypothetical protein EDE15_3189 [Edaphobacter aggregans]